MRYRVCAAKSGAWLFVSRLSVVAAIAGLAGLGGCGPPYIESHEPITTTSPRPRAARAPKIALRDPALLKPQAAPDCEDKSITRQAAVKAPEHPTGETSKRIASADSALAAADPASPKPADPQPANPTGGAGSVSTDLALRIKLEYERECYRQAEARVRERLTRLQASVTDTLKVFSKLERDYH